MKRIGILTFHRSINYGAFMQAYALSQQLVRRYGDIVEIVDFEKASKHKAYHAKPGLLRAIVYGKSNEILRERFQEDLRLLPLSEKTLITDDYGEVLRFLEGRYDIVIVGSDAVWAYNKGLGLNNPYWLFGDQLQCEKYSYAASAYSLDISQLSDEEMDYISSCLKSFSYIGVRDQETENLVNRCLPTAHVYRNCDPTVLLNRPMKQESSLLQTRLHLNPKKKLVTIMMARYEPIIYDVIRKLGRKDYQYVYLYLRMRAWERFLPSTPRYLYNLSPFEWYTLFASSFLNLTSFFHGTLLALRSGVPTISFDTTQIEQEGYVSKIQQLMTDLSLSEFFNSYQKGINGKQILDEVEIILKNHEEISESINRAMAQEAKKADSFFEKMDNALL